MQWDVHRLRQALSPYTLQLDSSSVAQQCAPRHHVVRASAMADQQAQVYAQYASQLSQQLADAGLQPAFSVASAATPVASACDNHVPCDMALAAFMALFRAAQHPLLVRSRYGEAQLEEIRSAAQKGGRMPLSALRNCPDFKLDHLCRTVPALAHLALPPHSHMLACKCTTLRSMLQAQPPGRDHAVVITSSFGSVLAICARVLESLHLRSVVQIDAHSDESAGQEAVAAFENGMVDVVLLQAETVLRLHGLHFHRASECIFYDSGINTAVRSLAYRQQLAWSLSMLFCCACGCPWAWCACQRL